MALLVRTWNVFHGNAARPERDAFLRETVQLAAADEPAVVCLQEVPPWSLRHLEAWSGMTAVGDVARRPSVGPVPWPAEWGRRVTELDHGLLRSFFTGQANAMLISPRLRVVERHALTLNAPAFRRAQAAWLRLRIGTRLAWARARTVCQAVRLRLGDGSTAVVANLHATNHPADQRVADAELLRAAVFLDALAVPGEVCVLAGDFNVSAARSWTLGELGSEAWGFSAPTPRGVDHVLVRGAPASAALRWRRERRQVAGRIVSDHAPVDVTVG